MRGRHGSSTSIASQYAGGKHRIHVRPSRASASRPVHAGADRQAPPHLPAGLAESRPRSWRSTGRRLLVQPISCWRPAADGQSPKSGAVELSFNAAACWCPRHQFRLRHGTRGFGNRRQSAGLDYVPSPGPGPAKREAWSPRRFLAEARSNSDSAAAGGVNAMTAALR